MGMVGHFSEVDFSFYNKKSKTFQIYPTQEPEFCAPHAFQDQIGGSDKDENSLL